MKNVSKQVLENSNITEDKHNQVGNTMQRIRTSKGVEVSMVFPEKTNSKAEQEFIGIMKKLYLDRVLASALQCPPKEKPGE